MSDTAIEFAHIYQIKQQIDTLTKQQGEALKIATRIGMTPEEAKECDSRGREITVLVERVFDLQKSQ